MVRRRNKTALQSVRQRLWTRIWDPFGWCSRCSRDRTWIRILEIETVVSQCWRDCWKGRNEIQKVFDPVFSQILELIRQQIEAVRVKTSSPIKVRTTIIVYRSHSDAVPRWRVGVEYISRRVSPKETNGRNRCKTTDFGVRLFHEHDRLKLQL